jgi:small subunit ribosomal protein S5
MDTTKPKQNIKNNRGGYNKNTTKRDGSENSRRPRATFEKPKPEFDQKMVSIRRVTRVVAGGRRMTFAVAIAIGDKIALVDGLQLLLSRGEGSRLVVVQMVSC